MVVPFGVSGVEKFLGISGAVVIDMNLQWLLLVKILMGSDVLGSEGYAKFIAEC